MQNQLYYGDNLDVLREYIPNESVDLIYLDPPFNSSRSYNVLFKDESGKHSDAQLTAFEDTWHWNEKAEEQYSRLVRHGDESVSRMMEAMRQFIGTNQMMAYLVMMAARLVELHRVLKPTGSLYLHCDPTASHYLKVVLDTIFGVRNYRNEIVWKRTSAHSDPTRWGRVHDVIFYYGASQTITWNPQFLPHDEEYIARFRNKDVSGRLWADDNLTAKGLSGGGYTYEYKGVTSLWRVPLETMKRLDSEGRLHFTRNNGIRLKRYLDETPGVPLQDVISDIFPINSQAAERLGYPTQKPVALLERIINASSNPGDVVLDPFAGCGTTIDAAHKLGRRWIGIDITHLSIALLKYRLEGAHELKPGRDYRVTGEPVDYAGACELAKDPYQFQWWALSLIQARPFGGTDGSRKGKKGADGGIDGIIAFEDEAGGKINRAIVQVKAGNVSVGVIRDLRGTIEREKAAIGILITLNSPTREMRAEAAAAGVYRSPGWQQEYPRIQILPINDLLTGAEAKHPSTNISFKQSLRAAAAPDAHQPGLGLGE